MTKEELEKVYNALYEEDFTPRYNISPTQEVPIILNEEPKFFQSVKWGILPKWMALKGKSSGIINVRSETALEKPMFKKDIMERRCVIPATSFFEWQKKDKTKIPFLIKRKDGKPITLAGIWSVEKNSKGNIEKAFSILTTEPNSLMKPIHDRMPVILSEKDIDDWLSDKTNIDHIVNLMSPYSSKLLEKYKISSMVNNPKNIKKEILNPI